MEKENFYIGQTFENELPSGVGYWCKWHYAHIEKTDNIYTIVKNQTPTPIEPKIITEDEQKAKMREIRDSYINNIEWRVSRYRGQKELKIETSDTAQEYKEILQYQQYLRDYPQSEGEWWKEEPKTYEIWAKSY